MATLRSHVMSDAGIGDRPSTMSLIKRRCLPPGAVHYARKGKRFFLKPSRRARNCSMPRSRLASLMPAPYGNSRRCSGYGARSHCVRPSRKQCGEERQPWPQSTSCSNSSGVAVEEPCLVRWTWAIDLNSKHYMFKHILWRITMSSPTTKTKSEATLAIQLERIGMRAAASSADDLIARATTGRWSVTALLEEVARMELADRGQRSLERRLRRSRVGRFKPMADFDWNWPRKIDRTRLEQVLTLGFLREERNVVLMGPNGVGKTMIARNLVHSAIH